eukprot:g82723.t1
MIVFRVGMHAKYLDLLLMGCTMWLRCLVTLHDAIQDISRQYCRQSFGMSKPTAGVTIQTTFRNGGRLALALVYGFKKCFFPPSSKTF